MGINLGDIGLISQGYSAAADADRARQQAIQDRAFQLDQRRRAEEQAIAQQQEFQRQQAFGSDLRNAMQNYGAGGPDAIPAQAAQPAVELDPRQQEGGDLPQIATPAKPSQTNYQGLLKAAQDIALKHGQLDAYANFKTKADQYQQSGLLDAVRLDKQGAPPEEVMAAINTANAGKGPQLKAIRKVDSGVYAAMTADDKPVQIDTNRILEGMLAPKDLFAHLDKSELEAAKAKAQGATQDAITSRAQAQLDASKDVTAARAEAARAKAEADRAKAQPNFGRLDGQVKSMLTPEFTSTDDSGRKQVDYAGLVRASSMASALLRSDPETYKDDLPTLVADAKNKLLEIQGIAAQQAGHEADAAEVQAKQPWYLPDKSFKDVTGKSRKAFVQDRTAQLVDQNLGRTPAPALPVKSAPAGVAPASGVDLSTPEGVRAAFQSGRISRDQARAALQQKFGYQ